MNPFRRNPEKGTIAILQSRATLYKNGPHYKAATRSPAYIQVTGTANSCLGGTTEKLPYDEATFSSTYSPFTRFKLKPILKEAVIEYGGEFGLAQSITLTIECYNRNDFERIEKAFLLPGNKISATFGYAKPWNTSEQQGKSIKDFRVATYSFSTTAEGYWIATCKAVAAAEAIKDIEVSTIIKEKNLFYRAGNKKFPVIGMAELIAYDAQKTGESSIDELQDGETISPSGGGNIVVYHADHLFSTAIGSWWNTAKNKFDGKTEAESTANVVYLSLEYIITRLLMGQIKEVIAKGVIQKDRGDFDKLKIKFDDKISHSWCSIHMRSGSPTSCLIMGDNKGNYKNQSGEGKNFETDCKNLSLVKAVSERNGNRAKIIHKKILLERSVVVKAFAEATKNRQSTSDSVDVKDTKENVLPIEDFLKKIFDHIGLCTGGAIQLRLIVHPDDKNTLVVADQNNGYIDEKLQVVVLNSIDGDGSTRSCNLQSNVGSEEYKAHMFAGVSKKGDTSAAQRGCKDDVDKKREGEPYTDAIKAISQILYNPGSLGANQFGAVQENALIQAIGKLQKATSQVDKFEMVASLGMSIEAELDGVYGFLPGNGISSKHLSNQYFKNNAYFSLKTVSHVFNGETSDWSTKLSGFLTFNKNVQFIHL